MISETRCGPMVYARLAAAAENSGKLVSSVRREARRIAEERNLPLVLADGPPGIGCPVIASLAGTSLALVVAEPTVSGEHDLDRALRLARHFRIPAAVCVNKGDLNPEKTRQIEREAEQEGARSVGRIRYDLSFTRAQLAERSVGGDRRPCVEDVRRVWERIVS